MTLMRVDVAPQQLVNWKSCKYLNIFALSYTLQQLVSVCFFMPCNGVNLTNVHCKMLTSPVVPPVGWFPFPMLTD